MAESAPLATLLAVDLGLRTGFAYYGDDGRLTRYQSHNLGSRGRLKKAAHRILMEEPQLDRLVLEGGGALAELWKGEGLRRGLRVSIVDARMWRRDLLLPREQRSGALAKAAADGFARRVITWSGAKTPKGKLKHDAAEAICIGFWACLKAHRIPSIPNQVARR